jgi:hypothetical protein
MRTGIIPRCASATCLFIAATALAHSQDTSGNSTASQPPKTKLEAFTGTTGIISIKGYTEIGTIKSGGTVEVTAMAVRNAKTGQQQTGILIEVTSLDRTTYSLPARSFLDYDEIQGLLDGIDYLSKLPEDVTDYPFFEARYSTKGDFSVVVFNYDSNLRKVAIKSGTIGNQTAYLTLDDLSRFESLITQARLTLDDPAVAKKATAAAAHEEAARKAAERATRAAAEQASRDMMQRDAAKAAQKKPPSGQKPSDGPLPLR